MVVVGALLAATAGCAGKNNGTTGSSGGNTTSGASSTTGAAGTSSTTGSGGSSSTSTTGGAPTPFVVTEIANYHPLTDGGAVQAFPLNLANSSALYSALVPTGSGSYAEVGSISADGGVVTFDGGAGPGSYFIRRGRRYYETTSHNLDLSDDVLGTALYPPITKFTPVTFNLRGFSAFGPSDYVELSATNDDNLVDFNLEHSVSTVDGGSTFTVGQTIVAGVIDFATYGGNLAFTASHSPTGVTPGDPFFAAQLAVIDAGRSGADNVAELVSLVDLTGQGVNDGVATTLTGTAVPVTATKPFSLTIDVPASVAADLPTGDQYSGVFFDLGAMYQTDSIGLPFGFIFTDSVVSNLSRPLPINISFNYANPYPANWDEVAVVSVAYRHDVQVSSGPGGTYRSFLAFTEEDLASNLPSAFAPRMHPVRALMVNNQPTTANLSGVGTTPTISWTAPTGMAPTSYILQLEELSYDATAQSVAAVSRRVVTLLPTTTSFTVPPNFMSSGHSYWVFVTAELMPKGDATHPRRYSFPDSTSSVGSHLLTP